MSSDKELGTISLKSSDFFDLSTDLHCTVTYPYISEYSSSKKINNLIEIGIYDNTMSSLSCIINDNQQLKFKDS